MAISFNFIVRTEFVSSEAKWKSNAWRWRCLNHIVYAEYLKKCTEFMNIDLQRYAYESAVNSRIFDVMSFYI